MKYLKPESIENILMRKLTFLACWSRIHFKQLFRIVRRQLVEVSDGMPSSSKPSHSHSEGVPVLLPLQAPSGCDQHNSNSQKKGVS